jgi:hypothetical protein
MYRVLQIEFECYALVLPPTNSSVLCAFASTPVSALEREREKERESLFSFQPFLLFQLISLCLYSFNSLLSLFSRPPIDSGSCTLMTYFIHAI